MKRRILSGAIGGPSIAEFTGVGLIQTLKLIESKHGADDMMAGSIDNAAHWSLLKVNPQKQVGYVDLLGKHCPGIESYYPVYQKMSRPHGVRRPMKVVRPVYPGYLFLRVGDLDMHRCVSLPVSARWVRFGGRIEAIPNFVIQRLQKLELDNQLVREVKYVNPFTPGVRVRVHLPVYDITAVIVKLVYGNRAVVDTPLCRVIVPIHTLQIL
jgi:hypothetical protein